MRCLIDEVEEYTPIRLYQVFHEEYFLGVREQLEDESDEEMKQRLTRDEYVVDVDIFFLNWRIK